MLSRTAAAAIGGVSSAWLTMIALPPALAKYIAAFVARRRTVALLRGAGGALAFAMAWALLACLLDRAVRLPAAGRWAALLAGSLGAAGLLLNAVARSARSADLTEVAAQIERRTDRFGQRLLTVVSQRAARTELRGSGAMLARAAGEAESLAAGHAGEARRLVPWRLAAAPWLAVAVLFAAFAALWPARALDMPRLVARLIYPAARIEPVMLTRLAVSPAGAEVAPGDSLTVAATAAGAEATATAARGIELLLSADGRTWSRAAMNPVSLAEGESRFEFPLPAIDRDLRYFVRGGDARSDVYQIRVKRTPAVAEFRIRYTYPAYTARAPLTITNTDGLIEGLASTEALVTIVSTEPLSSADLWVGYERIPMSPTAKPTEWETRVVITSPASCAVEMTSTANVRGRGPSPMQMRLLPDREPLVVIRQPSADLCLSAADSLTLHYMASDDYGLSALAAEVRRNGERVVTLPVSLPARAVRREGEFTFDLSDLEPRVGDVVELLLRAEDYGEHRTEGEPRRILVAPSSVNLKAYARAAELSRAAHLAAAWGESLARARDALAAARAADPRNTKQDPWPAANRALVTAGESAGSLRQALFRTIVRSESPALSTGLANLADRTVAPAIDAGRVLTPAARADNALTERLNVLMARSKEIGDQVAALLQGEVASLALTERANLDAVAAAAASSAPAANRTIADLRRKVIDAANQRIGDALQQLSLKPGPDLPAQLRQRIDAEDKLLARQTQVDFTTAIQEWDDRLHQPNGTGAELPARLAAAAQAESLRADADLVLARDLQLAARAAAAVAQSTAAARDADRARARTGARARVFEPAARLETVLRRLLQPRQPRGEPQADRASARAELVMLMADSAVAAAPADMADDLALAAGAAWTGRDYDAAAALDAKLADEVGRASQEESARFLDDLPRLRRDATMLDMLIARQQALQKATAAGGPGNDGGAALAQAAAEQLEIAATLDALPSRGGEAAGGVSSTTLDGRDASAELPRIVGAVPPSDPYSHHHPAAAAAWWARAAGDALARAADHSSSATAPTPSAALKDAQEKQERALAAMHAAWERLARRAENRRLEQVPALAPLFQPYASDEVVATGAWPRYGTRFHEGFRAEAEAEAEANAGTGSAVGSAGGTTATSPRNGEPAGYQDQLKAYFDAVMKVQRARR
jgi:hypothetical protein